MTSTGSGHARPDIAGRGDVAGRGNVACLQAGLVGIDVVGDDPPRVDPDDLRRQVPVGPGAAP